ncbi:hypothetical protein ScPMuIL_017253 [Solemya velum]
MVWTGRSPRRCEGEYKECLFMGDEKFECHFRRLQCIYKYCYFKKHPATKRNKQIAARLVSCLTRYAIPSPMWIDLRQ